MEQKQINAEWIWYLKAYRLYDPQHPQRTVAYADDLDQERENHPELRIVECDADTMHVELF